MIEYLVTHFFFQAKVALDNIVRLVDEMNERNMLPAMCFNDDRSVCESLAIRLAEELEARETVSVVCFRVNSLLTFSTYFFTIYLTFTSQPLQA